MTTSFQEGTMSDKEIISTFFNELKKYPQLHHDELINLFKTLDTDASVEVRNKIAQSNLRLVVSIAKTFKNQNIPLIDLVQEGSVGLLTAIAKFRWEKGYMFSTYATWWIRQAIQQHLLKKKRLIRLPAHAATVQRKIIQATEQLRDKNGQEPTNEELLEAVNASKTVIKATLQSGRQIISLNEQVNKTDTSTLEERIVDTSASPFEKMCKDEMIGVVKQVLQSLSLKEIAIIRLRSGLISDVVDNDEYNVTEEEEQQIILGDDGAD